MTSISRRREELPLDYRIQKVLSPDHCPHCEVLLNRKTRACPKCGWEDLAYPDGQGVPL